jgi:hypothetical protein
LSTLSPISASTSPTFSGPTPNFSSTSVTVDAAVVHRVQHVDLAVVDQLHQILVELTIVTFHPARRRH